MGTSIQRTLFYTCFLNYNQHVQRHREQSEGLRRTDENPGYLGQRARPQGGRCENRDGAGLGRSQVPEALASASARQLVSQTRGVAVGE